MQEGFIHGGAGEVRLGDILPAQYRAFSTKAQKEAFASQYEERNPNVIVLREWETEAEIAARKANRPTAARVERQTGMDPERAEKELRRTLTNIHGLDPAHPEYEKLWTNWTREANNYEEICGLPTTKFTKGLRPRKNDDPIPKELQDKLNKYVSLPDRKRRELVGEMKNADLLRLVRDNEPLPDVQMLAVERLAQVGAL